MIGFKRLLDIRVLLVLSVLWSSPFLAAAADPAFVGMQIQGVSQPVANALGLEKPMGVLVRDVALGGPSDKAGFRRGDLIVRFNGQDVESFEGLVGLVKKLEANAQVPVTIMRRGRTSELTLTTGGWPDGWRIAKGAFAVVPEVGLTVAAITEKARGTFNLRWGTVGLVASIVDPDKAASRVLRRGEVIRQVNQQDVWMPNQFMTAFRDAQKAGKTSLLLLVEGRSGFRFTLMPLE